MKEFALDLISLSKKLKISHQMKLRSYILKKNIFVI